MKRNAMTYSRVGDNYDTKDPVNKRSQRAARATGIHLKEAGFAEVSATRGESAFVWRQGNVYMASVLECLGTKSLVADAMRAITGKTYYDVIAHDTVATFINDLTTVGAMPLVVHAYWAMEDSRWLSDRRRINDFINGWKAACDIALVTWGGGETPTLKGVLRQGTVDIAGSAVGIISPRKRLLTDTKLKAGDRIVLLKSTGINANGVSLARAVAKKLAKGYATLLPGGISYGEAILQKSNIYARLVAELFSAGITLHYSTNITGHGLRKIMRGRPAYTYILERIARPPEIFPFIQRHARLSDAEMYATFNMGMDYALFMPKASVKPAMGIISRLGFDAIDAGYVENGPKRVVIGPKNIVFGAETLNLRG